MSGSQSLERDERLSKYMLEHMDAITPAMIREAKAVTRTGHDVSVRRLEDIHSRVVAVAEVYPRFFLTPNRELFYWDDVVRGMQI